MKDVYAQWDALCKEYQEAHDAHFKAFATVTSGFARVANGTGGNPSDQELTEFEDTWARLEEIRKRMDEFVSANT